MQIEVRLDTSDEVFSTWLSQHPLWDQWRGSDLDIPGMGKLRLQPLRSAWQWGRHVWNVSGVLIADPPTAAESKELYFADNVMTFSVTTLSTDRIRVLAKCDGGWPSLGARFLLLIADIGNTWPEAEGPVTELLTRAGLGLPPKTESTTEPAHADEDAPKTAKPWETIPDIGWNRKAVEYVWLGYTGPDMASRLSVAHKTLLNRLTDLRKIYGAEVVPYLRKTRNRDKS